MEHTVRAYDEELRQLSAHVTQLGELTERQLSRALQATFQGDAALARDVVLDDEAIDQLAATIERAAIRLIALRQPMADDLRRPISAMKIALNLERCGDLAKNIAKRGRLLAPGRAAGIGADIVVRLASLVAERLASVMVAYGARDLEAALGIWSNDSDIDAQYEQVSRDLLGHMAASPEAVEGGMHLLFVAKNLERIGDHATNIAELIHYEIAGAEPTGARPKLDPLAPRD